MYVCITYEITIATTICMYVCMCVCRNSTLINNVAGRLDGMGWDGSLTMVLRSATIGVANTRCTALLSRRRATFRGTNTLPDSADCTHTHIQTFRHWKNRHDYFSCIDTYTHRQVHTIHTFIQYIHTYSTVASEHAPDLARR